MHIGHAVSLIFLNPVTYAFESIICVTLGVHNKSQSAISAPTLHTIDPCSMKLGLS